MKFRRADNGIPLGVTGKEFSEDVTQEETGVCSSGPKEWL